MNTCSLDGIGECEWIIHGYFHGKDGGGKPNKLSLTERIRKTKNWHKNCHQFRHTCDKFDCDFFDFGYSFMI